MSLIPATQEVEMEESRFKASQVIKGSETLSQKTSWISCLIPAMWEAEVMGSKAGLWQKAQDII
jgi:hypothetical protein